ncbi:hypothetical protein ACQ4PT_013303 [Festuca glaucescens]
MGSVAAAVHEFPDSSTTALFLERCAASGDAAYSELRELLARLNDPATRQEARVFLAALGRISVDGDGGADEFFRRYGFCVRELLLHHSHCGLPITTLSSVGFAGLGFVSHLFVLHSHMEKVIDGAASGRATNDEASSSEVPSVVDDVDGLMARMGLREDELDDVVFEEMPESAKEATRWLAVGKRLEGDKVNEMDEDDSLTNDPSKKRHAIQPQPIGGEQGMTVDNQINLDSKVLPPLIAPPFSSLKRDPKRSRSAVSEVGDGSNKNYHESADPLEGYRREQ